MKKEPIWLTRNRFTTSWVRTAYEVVEERRVLAMVPVTENDGVFGIIRMDLV